MRRPVLAAVLAGVLAVGCGGGPEVSGTEPAAGSTPAPLGTLTGGDPLPDVELARLDGEGSVAMDELGGPAVLNFWATWCAFCVEEMPDLEEAHQAVGDDVRFVGIDREDPNVEAALALASETGVTYDLVADPDGSFFRAVKARGMPTTVFVDADGVIRYRHAGPLTRDQLLELVEEHLGVRA
ncbi:MAG: TlpA family protein disulfide reductase [Actinobacteria bacterium]|nr:TlpA family protein disulfide reductase [Actinomycetota bacterium]